MIKRFCKSISLLSYSLLILSNTLISQTTAGTRCKDLGINVGFMKSGRLNMITDVKGLEVGHKTLIIGDSIRTGVTAILPHGGNIFQNKVPAAIYCFNSFGKLAGYTQVEELGNIETPVVLTNTLSVGTAVEAVVRYSLDQSGDGSCMIVIATDAPLSERNLKRLAKRSFAGMARTNSVMTNGSGDYAIAFTTAYTIPNNEPTYYVPDLIDNSAMSILFRAAEEATQEAIYNSLLTAQDVKGYKQRVVKAIPAEKVIELLKKYNMYKLNERLNWNPINYD